MKRDSPSWLHPKPGSDSAVLQFAGSRAWTHPAPGPRDFDGPGPKTSRVAKKAKLPNSGLPRQVPGARDLVSQNPRWLNPDPNSSDSLSQIQESRRVHIAMSIVLLANNDSNSVDPSSRTKYSRHGSDADRIQRCLGQLCECSSQCKANMKLQQDAPLEFRKCWHLLSDDAQSHLLQVCYWSASPASGAGDGEQRIDDEHKSHTRT